MKEFCHQAKINIEGCLKGLQNVIKNNIWIVGGAILGILIPQVSDLYQCQKPIGYFNTK